MKDSKLAIIFIAMTVALLGVAVVFRSEADTSRDNVSDVEIPDPIDDSPLEPEEPTEPIDERPKADIEREVEGIVEGVVTEIFEDCSRKRVFENGQVVERNDEVSCDGGSYIIVDDFSINTVSGFTSQEFAFSYDIGDLEPGVRVRATYQLDSFDLPNFDCDECGIERL